MFESFLLFNISKQINTQQNCAEGRQLHPIEQMSSKGKVGIPRVQKGGTTSKFFICFLMNFYWWHGASFFIVPSFQTVKDS